jgi:ankyrin repeat protein
MVARYGLADIAEILLEARANVNYPRKDGATALCLAAQNGNSEAVKKLLHAGADVNVFRNPLWLAAQNGQAEAVKMLG